MMARSLRRVDSNLDICPCFLPVTKLGFISRSTRQSALSASVIHDSIRCQYSVEVKSILDTDAAQPKDYQLVHEDIRTCKVSKLKQGIRCRNIQLSISTVHL